MKLSIVLPVYNGAECIKTAITSIQSQSFQDWELLVINDGSIDETETILRNFNETRLKIITNPKNLGLQISLNIGLRAAQGEYIARIDADDEWITNDKLEKQINWLDAEKQNILIGSGWQVIDKQGEKIKEIIPFSNDNDLKKIILSFNPFCHSSVVFKKQAALDAGGYSQNNISRYLEDYDLWLRLSRLGKISNLPEIAVRYLDTNTGEARKSKKTHYLYFKLYVFYKYGRYYPNLIIAIAKWFNHLLFY